MYLPSQRHAIEVDSQEIDFTLEQLTPIDRTAPNQIGTGRKVDIASGDYGKLTVNQDGSRIRILVIRSPDAFGLRVHIEQFNIAPGDEVYVYGKSADSYVSGPYTRQGPFGAGKSSSGGGEFWTDTIEGDTVIIEHYMKSEESSFNISEVSHLFKKIPGNDTAPDVLACHNDAMCFGDIEKDAVGRITFVQDSDTFVCSGTMMNNRTGDLSPYFYTANHCVSTQAVAETVETFWFYRTTSCNSGVVSGNWVRTTSGTTVLGTQQAADSTLLRIFRAVPGNLLYAGWDTAAKTNGTSVFALSHPGGGTPTGFATESYLRRASGTITSTTAACGDTGLLNGYIADWSSGLTEQGSSGSGLFTSVGGNNFLVGVLSCGLVIPSCADFALYGRFSTFYPTIQTYMDLGDNTGVCAATPISVGQTVNGSLAATDCKSRVRGLSFFADRYSFSGTAGQQIAISMSSATVDTYLYLLSPDKSVAAQNDDGGGGPNGTNSRIPATSGFFILPSTGTFVIEATSFDPNVSGNYTLTLVGTGTGINPDTTGIFRPSNGALFLKNTNSTGFADLVLTYGLPGDFPVCGDWNGDGIDTIGVYRNGNFLLRNSNTNGFADIVVTFGAAGDQPVVGDWNGDGIDTIGIYRNGTFMLRNSNTTGAPNLVFALGVAGDIGIRGDWNGDGVDTTGVFRPSNGALFLKNTNSTGFADLVLTFGLPGDFPVCGDWNGDGIDTIGVYRNGTFHLRNSNTNGFAELVFSLGVNGDIPVSGDWNGLP